MNKHIMGLVLAGLICVGAQAEKTYANEVQVKNNIVSAQQSKSLNGWVANEYSWSYYKNGVILKSQWIKDNGKWYYADEYGYIKVNVTDKVGNKFYIFDQNGAIVEKSGWIKMGSLWFYGNKDGSIKVNEWVKKMVNGTI